MAERRASLGRWLALGVALAALIAGTIFYWRARPRPPMGTLLRFALSGAPAAGVAARISPEGGAPREVTADDAGRLPFTVGRGRVVVTDPATGAALLDRTLLGDTPELDVGIPVRLEGEVNGFAGDPMQLEVRCGYDEPIPAWEYLRLHPPPLGGTSFSSSTVHGLELPNVASRWVVVHPDVHGHFTTGWLALHAAPQVLVAAPDGSLGIHAPHGVASPRARETIPIGAIGPEPTSTLELALTGRGGGERGLTVGLGSLAAQPGSEARAGLLVALTMTRDAQLGAFLVGAGELPVAYPGSRRIAGLPPLASLKLSFHGPAPTAPVERSATFTGGRARLELDERALFGDRSARRSFRGLVRFVGGKPIARATVVYSSYPERFETTTDAAGRFRFDSVPAGRAALVFIDASLPKAAPPFNRVTITRDVDAAALAAGTEQVFELAVPGKTIHTGAINVGGVDVTIPDCPDLVNDDPLGNDPTIQWPLFGAYSFNGDTGADDPIPIGVQNVQVQANGNISATVTVTLPRPTATKTEFTINYIVQYTPFVYADGLLYLGKGKNEALTSNITARPRFVLPHFLVRVLRPNGNPVGAGVQVRFPGWIYDAEGYSLETDVDGDVIINCFKYHSFTQPKAQPVFIQDELGYYDGAIDFDDAPDLPQTTIRLNAYAQ